MSELTVNITNASPVFTANITERGPQGVSGTMTVGTVTTGEAGTGATITNVGTPSAAVLNFTIPKGDNGEPGSKGDTGSAGPTGPKGDTGDTGDTGAAGNGIASVVLTSGNHAAGTTDTYTVTFTDNSTTTFEIYNGADGTGSGDMAKSVYDPSGKSTDVFGYVDSKISTEISGIDDAIAGKADASDLTAHTGDTTNPHSVTLSQVGGSNRNLLDNGDFRNPVNSRGLTSYTGGGYTIDRWRSWDTGNITTIVSGGITVKGGNLFCYFPDITLKNLNVTLTVSIKLASGAIYSGSGLSSATISVPVGVNNLTNVAFIPDDGGRSLYAIYVDAANNTAPVIESVKLELGSVSTLANDPPANYALELAKCMGAPTSIGGLGGLGKVVTGSYVGTGTYGSSSPNVLAFPFTPKIVAVYFNVASGNYYMGMPMLAMYGNTSAKWLQETTGNSALYLRTQTVSWGATSINWHSTDSEILQLNDSAITYYYVAIG